MSEPITKGMPFTLWNGIDLNPQTTEAKNRFVAEKLGIKPSYVYTNINCPNCGYLCTAGKSIFCTPPIPAYPDFSTIAGAVELLRLMRKGKHWENFLAWINRFYWLDVEEFTDSYLFPEGALLDAVYEFFGGKEDESFNPCHADHERR